jgi:uncharacterized protein (DUF1778 family)
MATTKSRRLELRIDETTDRMIGLAARVMLTPKSAFVAGAAREAAEKVIARTDVTILAPEVFDAMMGSVDRPDPSAELAVLAEPPRGIRQ